MHTKMPLYHSIITTTAAMAPKDLTSLFRTLAKEVNKNSTRFLRGMPNKLSPGGVFRSCENYGLKSFPHRLRSPHASTDGGLQYHYLGRRIGMYYDCGANVLPILENILRMHHDVSLVQRFLTPFFFAGAPLRDLEA